MLSKPPLHPQSDPHQRAVNLPVSSNNLATRGGQSSDFTEQRVMKFGWEEMPGFQQPQAAVHQSRNKIWPTCLRQEDRGNIKNSSCLDVWQTHKVPAVLLWWTSPYMTLKLWPRSQILSQKSLSATMVNINPNTFWLKCIFFQQQ